MDYKPEKDEIAKAKMFINEYITKRKTINRNYNSYSLKHMVESKMGGYVSNDAFIQAAKELGYEIAWIPYSRINCWFNMSIIRKKLEAAPRAALKD